MVWLMGEGLPNWAQKSEELADIVAADGDRELTGELRHRAFIELAQEGFFGNAIANEAR